MNALTFASRRKQIEVRGVSDGIISGVNAPVERGGALSNEDVIDVEWDGLLGRDSATEHAHLPVDLHRDQCVFITGAGGSIGCALTLQLAQLRPRLLLLLDSSEQKLYDLDAKLRRLASPVRYLAILGSVDNDELVSELCYRHQPEMLYHAAAYKHVPLMESNPLAVVLNNTLGTYRLAQAAARNHIRHILMVSTDKAARPTSIMGVSKRMAEQALLACATPSTRVSCLRLGNVLASEGSVVGVFLDQIARGENITVTHPDVDRYFFTMAEAVSLILESASAPGHAQMFIPKTGAATKIVDLANFLIQQSSSPRGHRLVFTGLRSGEKLHEEFVGPGERLADFVSSRLRIVDGAEVPREVVHLAMADLEVAARARNLDAVLQVIARLVPEYRPSESLDAARAAAWMVHHG
ncbi:MAG: polysaccharide biosynthesis protein [Acidobacteriaceae bacterium]